MAWKILLAAVAAALLLLLVDPFPRTSPYLTVHNEGDAVVLVWEGPIDPPMNKALRTAVRRAPNGDQPLVLVLVSPGGSVQEGDKVIRTLRNLSKDRRIVTYVPPGAICASMCVPVFMAGAERVAAADSEFMFHDAYSVDSATGARVDDGLAISAALNANVFRRYIGQSIASAAIVETLEADIAQNGEAWRTGRQLFRSRPNIVTQISAQTPTTN